MSTVRDGRQPATTWSAKLSGSTRPASNAASAVNSVTGSPTKGGPSPATTASQQQHPPPPPPPPNAWAKGSPSSWSHVAAKRSPAVRPGSGTPSSSRSPERQQRPGRAGVGQAGASKSGGANQSGLRPGPAKRTQVDHGPAAGAGAGIGPGTGGGVAGVDRGSSQTQAATLPAPGVVTPGHLLFFSSAPDPLSIKYSETVSGEHVVHHPSLTSADGDKDGGSARRKARLVELLRAQLAADPDGGMSTKTPAEKDKGKGKDRNKDKGRGRAKP